jgi:FtsH-binding integral membrane protein
MNSKTPNLPWLTRQLIAQVILVILFLAVCVWISIQPNPFEASTQPSPPPSGSQISQNPTTLMLQATAYELEIEENRDQTMGIVFGGTMLVILIVGGTLLVIGKK